MTTSPGCISSLVGLDVGTRDRFFRFLRRQVEDDTVAHERLDGEVVQRLALGDEVLGRVDVGSRVGPHLETFHREAVAGRMSCLPGRLRGRSARPVFRRYRVRQVDYVAFFEHHCEW